MCVRLCCAGLDRVVVAVIDSGVELSSGAVGASLWTNAAEVAADGVDNDGNGQYPLGCASLQHVCSTACTTPLSSAARKWSRRAVPGCVHARGCGRCEPCVC
jgi:hypothetical protein